MVDHKRTVGMGGFERISGARMLSDYEGSSSGISTGSGRRDSRTTTSRIIQRRNFLLRCSSGGGNGRAQEMTMEAKVLRALTVRDKTIYWYSDLTCSDQQARIDQ